MQKTWVQSLVLLNPINSLFPGEGNHNPLQYSYLGNRGQRSLEDYRLCGHKRVRQNIANLTTTTTTTKAYVNMKPVDSMPHCLHKWKWSMQKQCPVVAVTGDGSKVQCCKEQYCTGTWNARAMNQGKLELVKQMTRLNIDVLAIGEVKWTRMGKYNSNDHYIYYCGQESLKRNGVVLIVNQRVWNAVLDCNSKNDRVISIRFQSKPFRNITAIQVYMPQPLMPKNLKLNSSMMTYKTF